jgi:hypothetical protein
VAKFDRAATEVFDTDGCASNRHAKERTMNEHDASAATEPGDDETPASPTPRYGDPAHDLFGNGWTPSGAGPAAARKSDYAGRHRAPDA